MYGSRAPRCDEGFEEAVITHCVPDAMPIMALSGNSRLVRIQAVNTKGCVEACGHFTDKSALLYV